MSRLLYQRNEAYDQLKAEYLRRQCIIMYKYRFRIKYYASYIDNQTVVYVTTCLRD